MVITGDKLRQPCPMLTGQGRAGQGRRQALAVVTALERQDWLGGAGGGRGHVADEDEEGGQSARTGAGGALEQGGAIAEEARELLGAWMSTSTGWKKYCLQGDLR